MELKERKANGTSVGQVAPDIEQKSRIHLINIIRFMLVSTPGETVPIRIQMSVKQQLMMYKGLILSINCMMMIYIRSGMIQDGHVNKT
jgi:hypothetical protein